MALLRLKTFIEWLTKIIKVLNDTYGLDLKEEDKVEFEKMKSKFAICDEPGCCDQVSCGTPTENGYRSTCGKHAPKV